MKYSGEKRRLIEYQPIGSAVKDLFCLQLVFVESLVKVSACLPFVTP